MSQPPTFILVQIAGDGTYAICKLVSNQWSGKRHVPYYEIHEQMAMKNATLKGAVNIYDDFLKNTKACSSCGNLFFQNDSPFSKVCGAECAESRINTLEREVDHLREDD